MPRLRTGGTSAPADPGGVFVIGFTTGSGVEVGVVGVAAAAQADVGQVKRRPAFSPMTAWQVSAVTPWAQCTVTA